MFGEINLQFLFFVHQLCGMWSEQENKQFFVLKSVNYYELMRHGSIFVTEPMVGYEFVIHYQLIQWFPTLYVLSLFDHLNWCFS